MEVEIKNDSWLYVGLNESDKEGKEFKWQKAL